MVTVVIISKSMPSGTNPLAPDENGLEIIRMNDGADQVTLTFQRPRPELNYLIESSADGRTWTESATNPGDPGGEVRVTLPMMTSTQVFRLRVTL